MSGCSRAWRFDSIDGRQLAGTFTGKGRVKTIVLASSVRSIHSFLLRIVGGRRLAVPGVAVRAAFRVSGLRRAAFIACLLFAQAALAWHHLDFDRHEPGKLCLTCVAGVGLDHAQVSVGILAVALPFSFPPTVARSWSYLPLSPSPFRSRAPPGPFLAV